MARTPTTMTCCRISEKFWPVRNRSLCVAKKAHARRSAMNGPSAASGGLCKTSSYLPQQALRPNWVSLLGTPAMGLSLISVTPVSVNPATFLPVVA